MRAAYAGDPLFKLNSPRKGCNRLLGKCCKHGPHACQCQLHNLTSAQTAANEVTTRPSLILSLILQEALRYEYIMLTIFETNLVKSTREPCPLWDDNPIWGGYG